MLSKQDELYLKLGESVKTDSEYLIRILEISNQNQELSLKAFKQGLQVAKKREDKYAIKQWEKKIDLYEKMIQKNNRLIDKLR